MEIQISSLNVRGIGDKQKRSELFNWQRSKKIFPLLTTRGTLQQRYNIYLVFGMGLQATF